MFSSSSSGLGGRSRGSWEGVRTYLARIGILAAMISLAPSWLRTVREVRGVLRAARSEPFATRIGDGAGPGLLEAVEKIRSAVPARASYILEVDPYGPGALTAIALRHAVLPRRPILLQRFSELKGAPPVRPRATVVIENDQSPPSVLEWVGVLERFDPSPLGVRDDSLLASVDNLWFDADGKIRIRGWCQGYRAVPCNVAAVLVNGRPAPLPEVSRVPRPDVESTLPAVGPCPRAGYELTLPRGVATGKSLSAQVVFRTTDGRWRIYPEQFATRAR